jgi:tRNA pseudouridine55 synthase
MNGVLVVDKPAGWTSHDVVAHVRRLTGIRRVGHAGTLDPMATGVLVLGLGPATRLLGYLSGADKEYLVGVRLGATTSTDDATGETLSTADPSGVTDDALHAAMARFVGELDQVPPSVSAIKQQGERAYRRARRGEQVTLPARRVRVDVFELLDRRGADLDLRVVCSAGTYVRALARDLGAALGIGAHLTALRRTRSGAYDLTAARPLDPPLDPVPIAVAAAAAFPRIDLAAEDASRLAHGRPLAVHAPDDEGPVAAFAPDGSLIALVAVVAGRLRPLCVFPVVSG